MIYSDSLRVKDEFLNLPQFDVDKPVYRHKRNSAWHGSTATIELYESETHEPKYVALKSARVGHYLPIWEEGIRLHANRGIPEIIKLYGVNYHQNSPTLVEEALIPETGWNALKNHIYSGIDRSTLLSTLQLVCGALRNIRYSGLNDHFESDIGAFFIRGMGSGMEVRVVDFGADLEKIPELQIDARLLHIVSYILAMGKRLEGTNLPSLYSLEQGTIEKAKRCVSPEYHELLYAAQNGVDGMVSKLRTFH